FPASLRTNLNLNGPGSARETRHFEIALNGSDLAYQVGDALGVMPTNCPDLVEELIRALGLGGEEIVPGMNGEESSLRAALLRHYEITRIPNPFLQSVAERSRDPRLQRLTEPVATSEQTHFLQGGEIIDLLLAFPDVQFSALEFVGLLRKLQPRLYS